MIANVSESVRSLHTLLGKIDTKVDRLDMALYNTQIMEVGQAGKGLIEFLKVAQGETQNFSAESRVSLDNFNSTLEHVYDTLEQLAALSSELSEIARDLNTGRGTAGELLQNKAYIESLNETIKQLTAFLEDIRKNPKKYVKFSIF